MSIMQILTISKDWLGDALTEICVNISIFAHNPWIMVFQGQFLFTDIDECQLDTACCNQECTNTEGSYNCTCHRGYSLISNCTCAGKTVPCIMNSPRLTKFYSLLPWIFKISSAAPLPEKYVQCKHWMRAVIFQHASISDFHMLVFQISRVVVYARNNICI